MTRARTVARETSPHTSNDAGDRTTSTAASNGSAPAAPEPPIDLGAAFAALPGTHLVLAADAPTYTVRLASAGCARAYEQGGRGSVVGRSALDVLPNETAVAPGEATAARIRATLHLTVATRSAQEMALQARTGEPDAGTVEERPRLRCVPVLGADGGVTAIVASLTTAPDIAGRTAARRTAELAAVFESMPDAVYIGTARGVTSANAAALRQFGYRSLAELNRRLPALAHDVCFLDPTTHARLADDEIPFARALAGESCVSELLMRHRRSLGARLLRVSAAPLCHAGQVVGAVVVSTDVTDERAMEAELRRSTQEARAAAAEATEARALAEHATAAKSLFLTTMSHELRTPLNAIAGYVDLMQLGLRGPVTERQREDLARIRRAEEHLLGLVNAVLSFARLGTGRVPYDLADVLVRDVIAEVEEIVRPLLAAKDLVHAPERCDGGSDDEPLLARADAEKLRQILINLLTNAVKFTARGGDVTVDCEAGTSPGGEPVVRVRVTDTGVGISADQMACVFEPFVQLGRQFSSTIDGVGLGLAISRDLARGMGGDLGVTSVPDVGSTFTVTLPRVRHHDGGAES